MCFVLYFYFLFLFFFEGKGSGMVVQGTSGAEMFFLFACSLMVWSLTELPDVLAE